MPLERSPLATPGKMACRPAPCARGVQLLVCPLSSKWNIGCFLLLILRGLYLHPGFWPYRGRSQDVRGKQWTEGEYAMAEG
jgi:hypothetical protein